MNSKIINEILILFYKISQLFDLMKNNENIIYFILNFELNELKPENYALSNKCIVLLRKLIFEQGKCFQKSEKFSFLSF